MKNLEENNEADSAASDLHKRTLDRLPSLLSQMEFLAGLRCQNRYEHWGLARRYGAHEVTEAASSAHTRCCLQLLREEPTTLFDDVRAAASKANMTVTEFARRAWERRRELTPLILGGGSAEHLHWILFVLWKIAEHSPQSPDSDAWPHRLPAR